MESDPQHLRLRIKTGEHEFEAEGLPSAIQPHLATFLRLIGQEEKLVEKPMAGEGISRTLSDVTQFFRLEHNIVSLHATSGALDRDVLLLLLGQQQLRGNGEVSGTELMAGLRSSGYSIRRADHILKRFAASGDVVTTGKRRRRRYRLTSDGVRRAKDIIDTLVSPESNADST